MKFLPILLLICNLSPAQIKTSHFIGKFQEYDYADGYFWYTFVRTDTTSKEFIRLENWDTLQYNLERIDSYEDKWFEIHYYDVYDVLGDDEEKRWYSRIKSLQMIPTPKSHDVPLESRFTFENFFRDANGMAWLIFISNTPYVRLEVKFDSMLQEAIPFDLTDPEKFFRMYERRWFNVKYRTSYSLEEPFKPVTRTIISLTPDNVLTEEFFAGRFEKSERRGDFELLTFLNEKNDQKTLVRNATRKLLPYHFQLLEESNPEFTDLWFEMTYTIHNVLPADSLPGQSYNEIEFIKLVETPDKFDDPKLFVGKFYDAQVYATTALYVFTDSVVSDLKFVLDTNEQKKIEYPLLEFTMANTKYLGKTFEIRYKKRYVPGLNAASGELISIKMIESK